LSSHLAVTARAQTAAQDHPSRLSERLLSWPVAGAIALTALGLALRLHAIDQESLWEDEGYTLLFSRLPIIQLVPIAGTHEHPPLYYLVVHAILAIKGWYLVPRLVAAVAGTLCLPLLARLGTRLFSPAAGLIAASLAVISPFQIWHAQNGRGYTLACLFVLLSYVSLLEAIESKRFLWWGAYALAGALALYTEYITALVLLPQAAVLFSERGRSSARAIVCAWGAIALGFAPWLVIALDNVRRVVSENYWIPPPSLHGVSFTALKFLGLMTDAPTMKPLVPYEVPIPVIAGHEIIVLFLLIAAVMALAGYALTTRSMPLVLVSLWLTIPFALILLLAPVRSLYVDRIFLDAAPALYLCIGWLLSFALSHARVLPFAAALLAVLSVGSVLGVGHLYASLDHPDWKTPMRDLQAHYRRGQGVVFYPAVLRTILPSYLPPGWHASRELALWTMTYLDVAGLSQRYAGVGDARLRDDLLSRRVGNRRQVWLLCDDYVGLWEVRQWFTQHGYRLYSRHSYFGWSDIELWGR
jgi:4-amino-4-deoxy-L-arabinose transferase-like glycosyltransferase